MFSPPKNLRKIRQPLDASRGHLTKSQLQKIFRRAQIISSKTWHALYLSKFRVQKQFQSQCRFLQNTTSISPVAAVAPCALFLLLIPAPHDRLDTCGRRRRAGRGAVPHARRQQRPLRLPERRSVGRRRPALPKPPEATAWPSPPLCTLQSRRRELGGTERAPCRRRARTAVPSRAGVLPKSDQGFS